MNFLSHRYVRIALMSIVALALTFQLGHFFEHVLQVYVWAFVDHYRIYMSPFAMAFERWFGNAYFSYLPTDLQVRIGKEFLHLSGDIIFLSGLIAFNLLYAIRKGRWALGIQSFHTYEHISLATTIVVLHKPIGLSTLYGLAVPQYVYVGYLLWFHFFFNLIPMLLIGSSIREVLKKRAPDATTFTGRMLMKTDRLTERVGAGVQRIPYRKTLLISALLALFTFTAVSAYRQHAQLQKLPNASRIAKECESYPQNGRSLCYQLRLRHLFPESVPRNAFGVIRELQSINPVYTNDACFPLAYTLGQDVVVRNPSDWASALQQIEPDGLCNNGYMQGIVDGVFGSKGSVEEFADIAAQMVGVCESAPAAPTLQSRGRCFQALGHALAAAPSEAVVDITPLCVVIANGKKMAETACLTGVQTAMHSMSGPGMMH